LSTTTRERLAHRTLRTSPRDRWLWAVLHGHLGVPHVQRHAQRRHVVVITPEDLFGQRKEDPLLKVRVLKIERLQRIHCVCVEVRRLTVGRILHGPMQRLPGPLHTAVLMDESRDDRRDPFGFLARLRAALDNRKQRAFLVGMVLRHRLIKQPERQIGNGTSALRLIQQSRQLAQFL
jgi:hypothetical protein